jgi:hypothetical protein
MDMQTIIKNSVGSEITNKITGETASISGVNDGTDFVVFVKSNENVEKMNLIQFVLKYKLEFTV